MITSAGAAGVKIGLLLVAISLRSDLVFGSKAPDKVKTLSGSSFTSLVHAFSLSILAIVPQTNIGRGMIFLSVFCLINTWRPHAKARHFKNQTLALIASTLNYLCELAGGITLVRPRAVDRRRSVLRHLRVLRHRPESDVDAHSKRDLRS